MKVGKWTPVGMDTTHEQRTALKRHRVSKQRGLH